MFNLTFYLICSIIYIRLFTQPLTQFAQAATSLQSTAAASERVFKFLDEEEMSDESHVSKTLKRSNVKGEIEFKNVIFSYFFHILTHDISNCKY